MILSTLGGTQIIPCDAVSIYTWFQHPKLALEGHMYTKVYHYISTQIGDPNTLLAKKVVTPPLKTIKPMWIEILCFHLAEIGMIWKRDCSPTKSDTTLGRHSMQGPVGSSSSETTV